MASSVCITKNVLVARAEHLLASFTCFHVIYSQTYYEANKYVGRHVCKVELRLCDRYLDGSVKKVSGIASKIIS